MADLTIKAVHGLDRERAFRFMKAQFAKHFGAAITDDTDEMYVVETPQGLILAAFGLNRVPDHFFCRHYIGDVRTRVADAFSDVDQHSSVVELAHLCVARPAVFCQLAPHLATFLRAHSRYVVCTTTSILAAFLKKKGIAGAHLGQADLMALPMALRAGWGDYYSHAPQVLAGDLSQACEQLSRQSGRHLETAIAA